MAERLDDGSGDEYDYGLRQVTAGVVLLYRNCAMVCVDL